MARMDGTRSGGNRSLGSRGQPLESRRQSLRPARRRRIRRKNHRSGRDGSSRSPRTLHGGSCLSAGSVRNGVPESCDRSRLKPGETVFIQAGASGLGIAAIQTAKVLGAKVVTTVGSEQKAEAVRALGADVVVNRKTDDLGKVLDENPVNVVLDCVGGTGLGTNLEKLAPGGRWILISTLGGEHAEIALRPILKRGLRLIGSTLRSRTTEMKGQILAGLEERIWPAIETGAIRPVIHKIFPIREAEQAHAVLECGENIGKVVLTVRDC